MERVYVVFSFTSTTPLPDLQLIYIQPATGTYCKLALQECMTTIGCWSRFYGFYCFTATTSKIPLGQRPGEVCGMRESELDGNWWAIPAERMKKRKPHRVYLTPFALSLLPADRVGDAVFRSEISRSETSSDSLTVGTLSYILKRAKYYGLPQFTPHDLRRTCRTFLAEIGIPREHAEAVLSHTMGGVEGTYNRHHYDQEKQLALEAWDRKLNSIINATESAKVIPITRKAA